MRGHQYFTAEGMDLIDQLFLPVYGLRIFGQLQGRGIKIISHDITKRPTGFQCKHQFFGTFFVAAVFTKAVTVIGQINRAVFHIRKNVLIIFFCSVFWSQLAKLKTEGVGTVKNGFSCGGNACLRCFSLNHIC